MYQPLFSVLKPLVFNGKSGVLHIDYRYDDQARLYLKEGLVEQVETGRLKGQKAAHACMRWVSIRIDFRESGEGGYTPDPAIDTNAILSYLEKAAKNIEVINKYIPDADAVFRVDSERLHRARKLNAEDFKIALLLDGKRSLAEVLTISGKSELAVLTHACKLILAGVARPAPARESMPEKERNDFLQALEEKLTELVGPAGSLLVEDAFKAMGIAPESLAREEIPQLLQEVGTLLDAAEKEALVSWFGQYQVPEASGQGA